MSNLSGVTLPKRQKDSSFSGNRLKMWTSQGKTAFVKSGAFRRVNVFFGDTAAFHSTGRFGCLGSFGRFCCLGGFGSTACLLGFWGSKKLLSPISINALGDYNKDDQKKLGTKFILIKYSKWKGLAKQVTILVCSLPQVFYTGMDLLSFISQGDRIYSGDLKSKLVWLSNGLK